MILTRNKVALYARFSSDNQRSESIDAQLRAMEAYCRQHNYEIFGTYIDEAKSATSDRRPSFQQMIADSATRAFQIVLVHKLDRFARNRYDSAIYKRELRKNGVSVCSVLENLDNSPESIVMESVLEGMNEYYSQNLAREVMKGMRENALQGKHTGGIPPLGYDIDPVTKKMILNAQEAEAVKLIFSMYAKGEGYGAILDALEAHQYKTKRGEPFKKNSLHTILSNAKYRGLYFYNRSASRSPAGTRNNHATKAASEMIIIEHGCPQIIDDNTFSIVQARLADRRHGGRIHAKYNYLLSGKVYCMECGRSMVGNSRLSGRNKRRYITYRCPSHHGACSNKEINSQYLEAYVIALMKKELFSPSAMKKIMQQIIAHNAKDEDIVAQQRATLQEALDQTALSLRRVVDAIEEGLISSALVARLHELEQEKTDLELQLAKLHPVSQKEALSVDPQLILQQFQEVKETPASPAFKALLQDYLDKIEIGSYNLKITLNTGLGLCDALNSTWLVKRQEIYSHFKDGMYPLLSPEISLPGQQAIQLFP